MAPVAQSDHDVVEKQLKDVLQDLYELMVQVNAYDTAGGRSTKDVLGDGFKNLALDLTKVYATSSSSSASTTIVPPELIQYVDNGRNPEIYTREFVENTRRDNQLLKGKMEAHASFRDVLAGEMGKVFPEMREEIEMVVERTGGDKSVVGGDSSSGGGA